MAVGYLFQGLGLKVPLVVIFELLICVMRRHLVVLHLVQSQLFGVTFSNRLFVGPTLAAPTCGK